MSARRTATGDRGATAVEYGLILFAVAAVVAAVLFAFGEVVVELFQETCLEIAAEAAPAETCA